LTGVRRYHRDMSDEKGRLASRCLRAIVHPIVRPVLGLLLLTPAGFGCERRHPERGSANQPPIVPVAPVDVVPSAVRAVVGRTLSVDVSRTDPDAPLATLKPNIDELDTAEIVLGLEEAFHVTISDDEVAAALGFQPHGPPTNLTLRTLARLVSSARRADASARGKP
jgi:acyl carrier protein